MITPDTSTTQKEIIKASHKRSRDWGVDTGVVNPSLVLSESAFKLSRERNQRLINIAVPFVKLLRICSRQRIYHFTH